MKEKETRKLEELKPIKVEDVYKELAEMKATASELLRRIKRLRDRFRGF